MTSPHRKLKRYETGSPRYLTFSCYKRLPLLTRAEWRDEFAISLEHARLRCGFQLLAWVCMPEHCHIILIPSPEYTASKCLIAIKQPLAQRALSRWKQSDAKILERLKISDGRYKYWQAGGGFDRNVRNHKELRREIEYIHHNPVRRGLVNTAQDWEWSSANWYAGNHDGPVKIDPIPQ